MELSETEIILLLTKSRTYLEIICDTNTNSIDKEIATDQYIIACNDIIDFFELHITSETPIDVTLLSMLYIKTHELNIKINSEKFADLLFQSISNSYSDAINYIASIFHNGIGIDADHEKSIELYYKGIVYGNLTSVLHLIKIYNTDKEKSDELHQIIIKSGNMELIGGAGILYFNGTKIPKDYVKARELLELVILTDTSIHLETIYFILVTIYKRGLGTDINKDRIIELITSAMNKGKCNDDMEIILADIYFDEKDSRALELYLTVFNKGNHTVIPKIARVYYEGCGVEINYIKAMEFAKLAPDNKNTLYILGLMYEKGQGCDRDLIQALEYYKLAYAKEHLPSIQRICTIYKSYEDTNPIIIECDEKERTDIFNLLNSRKNAYRTEAINYFISINKPEFIKQIYKYDDYVINILIDLPIVKEKNNHLKKLLDELTTYILQTPDGELYFELEESNTNTPVVIKSHDKGETTFKIARKNELGTTPFKRNYQKAIELYKTSYAQGNDSAIDYLCNIYAMEIQESSMFNMLETMANITFIPKRMEIIPYLLSVNRPDKIKFITAYNDYIIDILFEHYNLKKENTDLDIQINKFMAHIKSSPGGEFYLMAQENWKINLNK